MATAAVQIQVYIGTKELKEAIERYAVDVKKPVWEIIGDTWTKMLAEGDYAISVFRLYEESVETGMNRRENQAQRRFKLTMPPDLVTKVDELIMKLKQSSNQRGINRSAFSQEAIRRYLEPQLIARGYLTGSQFKDKRQAAKNLAAFRESLGLTRPEFLDKYLTKGGRQVISYPQYAAIERSGKGNIDRLLDTLAEVLHINKETFYWSTDNFLLYLKRLS